MSGSKCSYINCKNSSKNTPGLRKFSFPVKDKERCKKWVLLCGNPLLVSLNDDELKTKFLCHIHFSTDLLRSTKLPGGSLPEGYSLLASNTTSKLKTYSKASTCQPSDVINTETTTPKRKLFTSTYAGDNSETSTKKLREIHHFSTPECINETMELPTLQKNKEFDSTTSSILKKVEDLPLLPRIIVKTQLNHTARTPWTSEEKAASVSLFHKSPTMYRFLKTSGFILPSEDIIHKWVNNYNLNEDIKND